jgi:ectoine hydroxylase-related dioxygenase (phytanoyl-CoA dioxygenase family)
MPGSQSQHWLRDGPDEGYIDCFVPLIDLNEGIGPTAIQPNTHTSTSNAEEAAYGDNILVPLLKKGDALLFDYRTIHCGLGNSSLSTIRTLAYAVFRRKDGCSTVD